MAETAFSFVVEGQSVRTAFPGVGVRELALALLAGLPPEATWEGCRLEQVESPLGPATECLATRGPGAAELQLRLVEAFERQGVRVLEVYEGGPEGGAVLATARQGRWV